MPNETEVTDKSLSRIYGVACAGKCKHSVAYHLVRFTHPDGTVDLGCCKVDCQCMKYVEADKPNQEAR